MRNITIIKQKKETEIFLPSNDCDTYSDIFKSHLMTAHLCLLKELFDILGGTLLCSPVEGYQYNFHMSFKYDTGDCHITLMNALVCF